MRLFSGVSLSSDFNYRINFFSGGYRESSTMGWHRSHYSCLWTSCEWCELTKSEDAATFGSADTWLKSVPAEFWCDWIILHWLESLWTGRNGLKLDMPVSSKWSVDHRSGGHSKEPGIYIHVFKDRLCWTFWLQYWRHFDQSIWDFDSGKQVGVFQTSWCLPKCPSW